MANPVLYDQLFKSKVTVPHQKQGPLYGDDVQITSFDGFHLVGKVVRSPKEQRIVIAFHGYNSSKEADFAKLAPQLTATGSTLYLPDLRAHGKSEGDMVTWGIKESKDAKAWLDYVVEQEGKDLPIYFLGNNLGAASALLAMGSELPTNFKGVVAINALCSPKCSVTYFAKESLKLKNAEDEVEKLDQFLMKQEKFSLYDNDLNIAFRSVQRSALFLEREDFAICDVARCRKVYGKYPADKKLTVVAHSEEATKAMNEFFAENDGKKYDSLLHMNYPDWTMYDFIKYAANRLPNDNVYEFKGKYTTYKEFIARIDEAAKTFIHFGYKKGDAVTLCMPNLPQSLNIMYGLDKVGIMASMIHPLSAEKEIVHYLNVSKSKAIVVPDAFYEKVLKATKKIEWPVEVIVVRIQDALPFPLNMIYPMTKSARPFLKFPNAGEGQLWTDMIKAARYDKDVEAAPFELNRTAVILYSGGTTGLSKGICLTDRNFNALSYQSERAIGCGFARGDRFLAAMPIFHGFGLGIGIHTCITNNVCALLMPTVSTKDYADYMVKKHPNFIAGVPTIYKMLIGAEALKGQDLSFMKGMFVGGDSIPVPLKREVDEWLHDHGADIQVREGYGLTECVTASCLTPKDTYKEGSIGLAYPDTEYKIVVSGTTQEVPYGVTGEIVLRGPSVMTGYLNNPEATAATLKEHEDGYIWLHTGDGGHMDKEGYVFFHQRIKRLIVTSGYNVSPAQVENAINENEYVDYSCVIGIPDPYKMQRIKAFVVKKPGVTADDETIKASIIEDCRKEVASYALPRLIEFRDELPKTLVGKVAFHVLEEEEAAKAKAAEEAAKAESAEETGKKEASGSKDTAKEGSKPENKNKNKNKNKK